jgi:beta-glucosidase
VTPTPVNNCLKMHEKQNKTIGGVVAHAAWHQLHLALKQEAKSAGVSSKVVFLGDSITESWRGTNWGQACTRCDGLPQVFSQHFGQHKAVALGIGCDGTQHLNWRLQHGEADGLNPAVAVVLIGTNNLGVCNATGPSTFEGMQAVLQTVRAKLPRSQILALGLYPRGRTVAGWRTGLQPSEFSSRIETINMQLQAASLTNHRLHYLDCSSVFLDEHGDIVPALMPDFLHPSQRGAAALAQCLAPAINRLITS